MYVTHSCGHDPFSHGASTGSSGRKTDIPQTDHFVHLITGSLFCSKCPRGVYIGCRYPPTVCLFPETHPHTSLQPPSRQSSNPALSKSLICQKLYSGHCSSPLSLRATPEYVCSTGHPLLLVPRIPCRPDHKLGLSLSFPL